MPITTCGDLVTLALRTSGVNGVGQTPAAEDFNDCLALLNMMVAGWSRERWLVPDLIELALTATGAASYSIGPMRPDRVESAFARNLLGGFAAPLDYPLAIIPSREEYNAISLKQMGALPCAVFYDTAWPVGELYFWPVPRALSYELHVFFKAPLPSYVNLSDPLGLPPEYGEALLYGLALRISMNYGQEPRPAHAMAFRAALARIRQANSQLGPLHMPAELSGRGYGSMIPPQLLLGGNW